MAITRRRWCDEEDRVLINQVGKSPQNLQKAFEDTAEILGRTTGACELRWYCVLKKREDSVAFTLVGAHGASKNSKLGGTTKKINKTLWERIKALFK